MALSKARLVLALTKSFEARHDLPPDRSHALSAMIEALEDIDRSVLDRVGKLLLKEQPMYRAILDHRTQQHVEPGAGIGEMLAVCIATSHVPEVREHLGALFTKTVNLALEAKAQGKRSFKGLSFEAVKSLPKPEIEGPSLPTP